MKNTLKAIVLKTYHIVFYENEGDFFSKGVNITANTMSSALFVFSKTYPNLEPIFISKK